eukprot:6473344-Amphidinium_carterae.1
MATFQHVRKPQQNFRHLMKVPTWGCPLERIGLFTLLCTIRQGPAVDDDGLPLPAVESKGQRVYPQEMTCLGSQIASLAKQFPLQIESPNG